MKDLEDLYYNDPFIMFEIEDTGKVLISNIWIKLEQISDKTYRCLNFGTHEEIRLDRKTQVQEVTSDNIKKYVKTIINSVYGVNNMKTKTGLQLEIQCNDGKNKTIFNLGNDIVISIKNNSLIFKQDDHWEVYENLEKLTIINHDEV